MLYRQLRLELFSSGTLFYSDVSRDGGKN